MKKTTLSLIALFAALQFSYAQWTTGTNIYNTNTGNVGIGTTNPQASLSVKGSTLPGSQWSGYTSSLQVGELLIQDYNTTPQVAINQNAYYDGISSKYILNGYASGMYMGANGTIGFSVFNSGTSGAALSGTGTAMSIANNGNIGVGTTTPGAYGHGGTNKALEIHNGGSTTNAQSHVMLSTGATTNVGSIGSISWAVPNTSGSQKIAAYVGSGLESSAASNITSNLTFATNSGGTIGEKMRITSEGNVAIGTTDPKGYKLAVNGSAIATSMKVKLNGLWPDFVFLKNYKLPTLKEVKIYIDKNQHLPDMPSADEVQAKGLDLGEMNRLMLKKVEELTLYLIQKDEQLKDQKRINRLHQEQIDKLKKRLNTLSKSMLNK